jgi:3-phenylpropionate/cinnamic acid dioxygenase small subunit
MTTIDAATVQGISQTIATYTQALDDGRTDDIVATFCADGSVDIPFIGAHQGHAALREIYAKLVPQVPQRHLVVNTLVTDADDHEARAVSDIVFLLRREAGWAVQLVGRYTDTLHQTKAGWRFHHRAAEFVN